MMRKKYAKYTMVPIATKAKGEGTSQLPTITILMASMRDNLYLPLLTAQSYMGVKVSMRCLTVCLVGC